VIFVAVGEDDGADVGTILLEVGDVRDDEIDAQELGFRDIMPASMTRMSSPTRRAIMFMPNSPRRRVEWRLGIARGYSTRIYLHSVIGNRITVGEGRVNGRTVALGAGAE